MKADNVLIVNIFGIGDVLFSTPLIKDIRRSLPRSNVYFLCNKRNYTLLKNNPDVKSVLVYEKDDYREAFKRSKMEFIGKFVGFIRDIKKLEIDCAIDLTLNYQMSIILILAGVRMRIGFDYKNRGKLLTHKMPLASFEKKHVAEYYLDLLKFLDIAVSGGSRLWTYTSAEDKLAVDRFLKENDLVGKSLVGIAAGGGKSWGMDAVYRRWGCDNFGYVGKRLSDFEDVRMLIFGTLEEKEICEKILAQIGSRAFSLCGDTYLGVLVEFISRLKLLICNEGGPLHIAVSQGVRTISIFGPVDDRVYGPFPHCPELHRVVKAEGVECRPCYKNFKHDICEDHSCLHEIDRTRVAAIAEKIIAGGL